MRLKLLALVVVAAALVALGAGVLIACSESPTSVAVRSFERAQRMDVVCLQVYDPATGLAPPHGPIPLPQEQCAPVAVDVNGGAQDNQLYALVTQTSRGELAAVNLSAGFIQDEHVAAPGINFIPVGGLPTDVATTPDGMMAFVAAAEPNKPAIYGVPTYRVLGDTPGFNTTALTLPDLPVCALPQNPSAVSVVPRRKPTAGSPSPADGGTDAGSAPNVFDYELVVVLPGDRLSPGKIVTIDPLPFLRTGARDFEKARFGDGPALPAGGAGLTALPPCPITAAIELVDGSAVPPSFRPGATWDEGVAYVDGGIDLTCDTPLPSGVCGLPPCCPGVDAGTDGGGCAPLGPRDAGDIAITHGPLDPPRLIHAVRDDQTLYVADANLPLIHVVDLSTPGQPQELPPLVATSISDPSRVIAIRDLAVSPPTRDFKRFLYAIDRDQGSLLVYDVTEIKTAPRTPMRRPNPELNPFQPEDRIAFSTPAVAVSFARHDFPLSRLNSVPTPNAAAGLLCNPNPNLDIHFGDGGAPDDPNRPFKDLGFFYRNDSTDPDVALGPRRLRGIFAFATLANGSIIAIDVDDWDTACRRPRNLSADPNPSAPLPPGAATDVPPIGDLAAKQLSSGTDDIGPYRAPFTDVNATSEEITYPIAAPHRLRSDSFIKSDSANGNHVPRVDGRPQLTSNGSPFVLSGPGSEKTPLLLPPNQAKPTDAATAPFGVQFSVEVPDVHIDQDWVLAYEGLIPGFDGLTATLDTPDGYRSMVFSQPNGRFCAKGVEDWDRGRERAAAIQSELLKNGGKPIDRLDKQITDYVQITEDLLVNTDVYWGLKDFAGCWEGDLADAPGAQNPPDLAGRRADTCGRVFGLASDQNPARDFPIVEAYEDKLVVTTFRGSAPREADVKDAPNPADGSNPAALKLMRCCFHDAVKFTVRTGGLWSIYGNQPGSSNVGIGFMSHLTAAPGDRRCVPSCDPREALLNSRAPAVPSTVASAPTRNSALALRNPMFSFWMLDGVGSSTPPPRGTIYNFNTRGQYTALLINLASTTIAVNPQSMLFIDTLGQIAIVDAASQGLVLIDLGGVAVAHAPYF